MMETFIIILRGLWQTSFKQILIKHSSVYWLKMIIEKIIVQRGTDTFLVPLRIQMIRNCSFVEAPRCLSRRTILVFWPMVSGVVEINTSHYDFLHLLYGFIPPNGPALVDQQFFNGLCGETTISPSSKYYTSLATVREKVLKSFP